MTTQIDLDTDFNVIAELKCKIILENEKYIFKPSNDIGFTIKELGIVNSTNSKDVTDNIQKRLHAKTLTFVDSNITTSPLHQQTQGGSTAKRKKNRRKKSRKQRQRANLADHI
jgi:hypothetical protein